MKSKLKAYTVIGLCACGCDDAFVEHVRAATPEGAAKKALRERAREGTVAAVIEGTVYSVLTSPVST